MKLLNGIVNLNRGTKEHFKDFGLAMKYKFPDKEGGDAFVGFEDIL